MRAINLQPGIVTDLSEKLSCGELQFFRLGEGKLVHSSGLELLPLQSYNITLLPDKGEWLVVRQTKILLYQEELFALNELQSKQKPSKLNKVDVELSSQQLSSAETEKTDNTVEAESVKVADTQSSNSKTLKSRLQKLFNTYPEYLQQSTSDCGAACLMMLGKFWGKHLDYNRLVRLAQIDKTGSSLQNLIDAANQIGFDATPGKTDLLGLSNHSLPVIAHWEGNHYIVVYRIDKKNVTVGDPKIGKLILSRSDFCRGWTGYAIWVEPTVQFNEEEEERISFLRLAFLLAPYKAVLTEILIASVVVQVLGLVSPMFTQILIDDVISSSRRNTFLAIGSGLLIVKVVQEVIVSVRRYLLFHTGNRLDLSLIVNFVSHALKLPLSYFDSHYVGDVVSRIEENRKIRQFITVDAITTILDVCSILFYAVLMFWYSPMLSFLALSVVPILVAITLFSTPILMKQSRIVFETGAAEQSYLIEFLSGIGTVKSMGIEQTVLRRWQNLIGKYFRIFFSTQMLQERLRLVANLSEIIISISVLLLGIWQVMNDQLTIGQLIAFNMLVGQVISPCKRLTLLYSDFQEIRIALERTSDILKHEVEPGVWGEGLTNLSQLEGNISFESVSFRYKSDGINIIDNISFKIKPRQTVALVGASGSGKTTVSKLLQGLYPPTEGKIRIDGHQLNTLSKRSYRKQISVVDQNTFLFGGTVRENLTVAYPNATQSEIESALKIAHADEFISQLPNGYETKIGEGGGNLSGGQRQRLALARALIGNPSLLILDEATSNLDTESERIILENLRDFLSNQTTLVIAHRLSTIRDADLIIVMEKGQIVESGTHAQLINHKGMYHRLVNRQLGVEE